MEYASLVRDVLCVGSYYYGTGDVVHEIVNGFREADCINVYHYDPRLYDDQFGLGIIEHRDLHELSSRVIDFFLTLPNPVAIVMIAGGISLINYDYIRLKSNHILVVSMQLSDPDDFARRGSEIVKYCDVTTTNSPSALLSYPDGKDVRFMLWGRPRTFDSFLGTDDNRQYDAIILGGYRPERMSLVRRLSREGIRLIIAGGGWKKNNDKKIRLPQNLSRKRILYLDHQVGYSKIKLINSAKVYISFSETNAGHSNLKYGVFESFAARTPVISDWVEEEFNTQLQKEKFSFKNLHINPTNGGFADFATEEIMRMRANNEVENLGISRDWSLSWKERLTMTLPEIFK